MSSSQVPMTRYPSPKVETLRFSLNSLSLSNSHPYSVTEISSILLPNLSWIQLPFSVSITMRVCRIFFISYVNHFNCSLPLISPSSVLIPYYHQDSLPKINSNLKQDTVFFPVRLAKTKKENNTLCWAERGEMDILINVVGEVILGKIPRRYNQIWSLPFDPAILFLEIYPKELNRKCTRIYTYIL